MQGSKSNEGGGSSRCDNFPIWLVVIGYFQFQSSWRVGWSGWQREGSQKRGRGGGSRGSGAAPPPPLEAKKSNKHYMHIYSSYGMYKFYLDTFHYRTFHSLDHTWRTGMHSPPSVYFSLYSVCSLCMKPPLRACPLEPSSSARHHASSAVVSQASSPPLP